MGKEAEQISGWYVTGLVEGEGCFGVSFTLRNKPRLGIETRPSFSISLNRRDLELLKQIQAFFKCGAIRYSQSDRTFKFEVRSVAEIVEKVLPHFEAFPLRGGKKQDFERFARICRMVRANLHRSPAHLPEIIAIAFEMNPSGKRPRSKEELMDLLRAFGEVKV